MASTYNAFVDEEWKIISNGVDEPAASCDKKNDYYILYYIIISKYVHEISNCLYLSFIKGEN